MNPSLLRQSSPLFGGEFDVHAPYCSESLHEGQANRSTLADTRPGMETSAERRRRKLTQLCRERGVKNVADRAGVSWQSLNQVIQGTLLPAKKDGSRTPRSLGDDAARKIEDAERLGLGWFDAADHQPATAVTAAAPSVTLLQALQVLDDTLSALDSRDRSIALGMLSAGLEKPGSANLVAVMLEAAIESSKRRAA